jgi:putative acetyltransferase
MQLQDGVLTIVPDDFPQVIKVWEASVRATHDFVSEADINIFRPMVWAELPRIKNLLGIRGVSGQLAGFIGVVDEKIEMLFIDPEARGMGAGKRLLRYAIDVLNAKTLDVNEQNQQAVGFYLHMGFEVVGRSELDGMGKPYPILHLWLSGRAGTSRTK